MPASPISVIATGATDTNRHDQAPHASGGRGPPDTCEISIRTRSGTTTMEHTLPLRSSAATPATLDLCVAPVTCKIRGLPASGMPKTRAPAAGRDAMRGGNQRLPTGKPPTSPGDPHELQAPLPRPRRQRPARPLRSLRRHKLPARERVLAADAAIPRRPANSSCSRRTVRAVSTWCSTEGQMLRPLALGRQKIVRLAEPAASLGREPR